jgi:hypothetical protein
MAFVPVAALFFTHDTAIIAAIGFSVLCGLVSSLEARLYDLCIRVKRTNAILSADHHPLYLEHLKEISLRLFYLTDALDAEDISKRKSDEWRAQFHRKLDEVRAVAAESEQMKDQGPPRES